MSSLFLILLIGTTAFIGYIFFLFSSNKPRIEKNNEIEDLESINKMKEMLIIKETKQLQTITAKNALFARAYKNKFGKEINEIKDLVEEENDNLDNIVYAARTIIEEKKDIYNSNPITTEIENISVNEEEFLPDFDENIISELRNEANFLKNKKEIAKEEAVNKNEKPMNTNTKNIEDNYTEEELFVLNSTYKTMQRFYY